MVAAVTLNGQILYVAGGANACVGNTVDGSVRILWAGKANHVACGLDGACLAGDRARHADIVGRVVTVVANSHVRQTRRYQA